MLDLVYHILSNDANVSGATTKITTDLRVQTEGTPAITMDWVSTTDRYFSIDSCKHYVYTVDVLVYSKTIGECSQIMGYVSDALDRYKGAVSPATGNSYTVVNSLVQNRAIETYKDADLVIGTLTFEITA